MWWGGIRVGVSSVGGAWGRGLRLWSGVGGSVIREMYKGKKLIMFVRAKVGVWC